MELVFFRPGLRRRIEAAVCSTTADRPRSVHFPEGLGYRNRESSPLRKMTSAAYTVGRDSVAEATAVGCQARIFPSQYINLRVHLRKIRSMARPV